MNGEAVTALAADDPANILTAATLLRRGGVLAIPTDTVYGLAASVFHAPAIERVFTVKRRSPDVAVPVLLATAADLPLLVREVPRVAWKLIERFWPGPLTLVLPARPSVSPVITAGGETVAVRVPAGRSTLLLLETLGEPIIGTSANRHGFPPAVTAAGVIEQLGGEIDAILVDDSVPRLGVASTVVEVTPQECTIHRLGAVSAEDVRQTVGLRTLVRR